MRTANRIRSDGELECRFPANDPENAQICSRSSGRAEYKNCKSFALARRLSRINLRRGRDGCIGLNSPLLESPHAASYNNNMGNERASLAEIQTVASANAVKQDRGARIFAVVAICLFAFYLIGALATHA